MKSTTYNKGDKIKFFLDNSPSSYGEGIITAFRGEDNFEVSLTTNCKEFNVGEVIMVSRDEFTDMD